MINFNGNSIIHRGATHAKLFVWGAVVVCAVSCGLNGRVAADVIIRNGEARPLVCRIEEQSPSGVVVRISDPDGSSRRVTLRADEILLIVPAQDAEKLATLEPGAWDNYRLLAEEAAARRVDPDAAALAIRLQLIVAFHSEGAVREGAFAALFDLARHPDEERRLRALAYRMLPNASPGILVSPRTAPPATLDNEDRDLLLRTVRLLRAGEREAALDVMRRPQFLEIYSRVAQILPFQELQRYAYDRGRSTQRTSDLARLEYVLLGESTLMPSSTGASSTGHSSTESSHTRRRSNAPWQRPLDEPAAPWIDVDWPNVTEFDPRECLFRDGNWRRP